MTTPAASARRPRVGRAARRALLVLHLLSVASWFGADVVVAVLVGTAAFGDRTAGATGLAALDLFAVPVLFTAGLAALATGIALGWATHWGVLGHWWTVAKLVINLLLTALVPIGLAGTVAETGALARRILDGSTEALEIGNLAYPPIVAPVLLVVAVVLAVVRPWGRTPWSRARWPAPTPDL